MSRLKVTMTDVNGVTRVFDNVLKGTTLMEVARRHGVAGILGDCGGGCSCATCHVYVNEEWFGKVGEPPFLESTMLDLAGDARRETSRLSCQIQLKPDLDGIEVTVAPSPGD
ncbi:MAG TPA: 2Fe-2S iron-sulfur cluster-binding protein [Novosphingobium sp.]|nr:2Fe-2S iron-sulfur cluster-binding protein [Novosphingobium sp.]